MSFLSKSDGNSEGQSHSDDQLGLFLHNNELDWVVCCIYAK